MTRGLWDRSVWAPLIPIYRGAWHLRCPERRVLPRNRGIGQGARSEREAERESIQEGAKNSRTENWETTGKGRAGTKSRNERGNERRRERGGKKRKAERAKQRQTKRDEEKGRRVPRNKATENVTLEAVNWSVPVLVARSQRFARIPVPRDVSICLDDREEISSGPRGKQLQTAKLLQWHSEFCSCIYMYHITVKDIV